MLSNNVNLVTIVKSHIKKNMHFLLKLNENVDFKHLNVMQNDIRFFDSATHLCRNVYLHAMLRSISLKNNIKLKK